MSSAAPGSPIWRAAGFGWLLLSPSRRRRQSPLSASVSFSTAKLCDHGRFVLVQEA